MRPAATSAAFGDWESIRDKAQELTSRPPKASTLMSPQRCVPPNATRRAAGRRISSPWPPQRGCVEAVVALADSLRRDTVGDDVTFVVNRNINFTNICYTGCRFCAFAPSARVMPMRSRCRRGRWATGPGKPTSRARHRGLHAQGGIDP